MNPPDQGAVIKQIRQQYNLTAQQVAEMAGVPLRVEYLMEIGCPISTDDATKVMRALSILTSERSGLPDSRPPYDGSQKD